MGRNKEHVVFMKAFQIFAITPLQNVCVEYTPDTPTPCFYTSTQHGENKIFNDINIFKNLIQTDGAFPLYETWYYIHSEGASKHVVSLTFSTLQDTPSYSIIPDDISNKNSIYEKVLQEHIRLCKEVISLW